MIKIYLDWNVMSGMKNGYFDDLTSIVTNQDKFLLVYSSSHISDISSSLKMHSLEEEQLINSDLEYLAELTKSMCLVISSEKINIHNYSPKELFEQRIDTKDFLKDFSIEKLFNFSDESDPNYALVKNFQNILSSLNIDPVFQELFKNPESSSQLETLLPGFKNDLTMSGFFKSIGTLFYNLNETESYKDLRQLIQNVGINSSHFNQDKNPFDLIEKSYLKYNIKDFNPDDYMSNTSGIPKWFNEITNEYLKLDMHGFKADKIKVTEKEKNTFKNTTEDASHSSFASMCEFYITNDDKNYHKTKAVFEKLNIRTKVLKPQEFVEYFRNYLNIEGFEDHFRSVFASIKEEPIWRKQFDDNGNLFGNIGYSNKYFFNFFNKIMLPEEDENVAFLILSKESPANTFIISFLEIENLVKSFVNHLGPDFYGKTYFDVEEVNENQEWCGRIWKTSIGEFVLMSINNQFQLYLYRNQPI